MVAASTAHRLGEVCLELGELETAEEHLLWALGLYRAGADRLNELNLLPSFCELLVRTGRLEAADEQLAEAQRSLAGPEDWGGVPAAVALAEG